MPISDLIPWRRSNQGQISGGEGGLTLSNLQQDMNRLFEDFFDRPFGLTPFWDEGSELKSFIPDLDISDTEKEIVISAELPGMNAEDIDLSITGKTLTISGEKSTEEEQKDKQYYRKERIYGSFLRSIPLPGEVDPENVEASYKRGVLKVTLPKLESEKSASKQIKINQG